MDMDIDMFSDSSEEEQFEESIPSATDCIEELVTSFLFQLSAPGGNSAGSESESEDDTNAKATPVRTPLELRLADRREEGTLRTMRFPVKRATGSARPFAQLFRVLDLVHEAVVDDIPATKRDIYYKDVPLFKKQKVVDNLVDDLAATFELDRADLNVRATSKGLVCGSGLTIHLRSGERLHATDTEGTLIPVGEDIETFTVTDDVEWVLLVEKDAIFQTLCRVRFASHTTIPGRGIIITGKGYPDVATRQLVATLSSCLPRRIPLLGLVDGDPYGLDILSVYKYGSRAMAHEADKLAAPRVKYLGVLASELASFGVDRDALLPITKADEKKALTMLSRQIPARWSLEFRRCLLPNRKELSHMLHSRRKAEIEVLASAGALGRRDAQPSMEAMSDMDPPLSTSQTTSSGPTSTDNDTPPTSQDLDAPPESALVQYLVTKIRDYVERAKARNGTD